MRKIFLRILLLFFGLNVFTACYGMPPGEWPPMEIQKYQDDEEQQEEEQQDQQDPQE